MQTANLLEEARACRFPSLLGERIPFLQQAACRTGVLLNTLGNVGHKRRNWGPKKEKVMLKASPLIGSPVVAILRCSVDLACNLPL